VAALHSGDQTLHRVVGPAIHQAGGWVLPVLSWPDDPAAGPEAYEREARKLRCERGFEAARSCC
jgi:hypothetical protein